MNKINFLVNSDNETYRLFSVMHGFDSKKEPYLKIVIPSIKSQSATLVKTDSYIQPMEQDSLFSKAGDSQVNNIHELSFHYISGVMHFKNAKNEYIGQTRDSERIGNEKFMLVSRLVFNNLEKVDRYNKEIKNDSIVLNLPFNELGRLFEVYLTTVNLKFENTQFDNLPQIDTHVLDVHNSNVHIVVNEYCYFKKDLIPENISFSWFLPQK